MSCSHATTCPLFPHLHSSLAGWKRTYCDSNDGWHNCARYEKSLTGETVPLSLLPNGKMVQIMEPDSDGATAGAEAGVDAEPGGGGVAVATDANELPETVSRSWWKRLFGRSGS